ncbi:MAG: hypothetical protein AMJ59_12670 [Gammaproteobacteria bacterium SG8_31]|nr:MAG: hypothetical protein AMJ59_12670 [Gammaproteobacteria bacterium SG8_31]
MSDTENKPEDDKIDPVEVVKAEDAPEKAQIDAIEPEEGIQELKLKLEQERMARIEAEKQAKMAYNTAAEAKNEVQDTNLQLVKNAIDTVKRNNDILKYSYSEALSVGDYAKAAEIQESLSMNSAKLMELERGRAHMENAPKIVPQEPARRSDPVEELASQLSPRSADWVRRNPQCVTDPRMYQKMVAAHNLAVADGLQPDTDEYFATIEDTLRLRSRAPVEQDDDAMSSAAKVTQRRYAPPAAPVSRGGNGTGSRSNGYILSPAEKEHAAAMGMSEKAYYDNKMLLKKEGRLQ